MRSNLGYFLRLTLLDNLISMVTVATVVELPLSLKMFFSPLATDWES